MPFGSREPAKTKKVVKRPKARGPVPGRVPAAPPVTIGKVPKLQSAPGAKEAKAAGRRAEQSAQRVARKRVPKAYVPKLTDPDPAQRKAALDITERNRQQRKVVARSVRKSAEREVMPSILEDAARSFGWKRAGTRPTITTKSGLSVAGGAVYEGKRKAKPAVGPDWLAKDEPAEFVYTGKGDPYDKRNWSAATDWRGPATSNPLGKLGENAIKDAAELVVTTPTSVAKLAQTAVTDPGKVPGMLAEPYKEFAKNPVKAYLERPISTSLMLAPAVRVPGRAAGKVARVTGKQTLKRTPKTLPGTALREARTGSRDVVVNALQKRRDRKAGLQTMTPDEVQRRVDEFHDVSQKHRRNVEASATREAKRRTKAQGLKGDQRSAAIVEHLEGARGGAGKTIERRFAEEFGSTWQRTPEGATVKPKAAEKGALLSSRADADAIAEKLPFEAVVKPVGDQFAVLPKVAADRLYKHQVVGSSKATGSKVMRTTRQAFTGTVLPLSGKWLFGQAGEAGLRSAVAGAGPTSWLRERRIYKALEAQRPGAGREFRMRTSGGGQFGLTGTAREFANGKSLAEEFADTGLAKPAAALTKAGAAPGVRHVRRGWRGYSNFVFNTVNGAIEQTAQRAMAGKAIKNSPLMERSVLGLTDKAVQEAAKGLRATENQVAAGRAVTRMYGQYSKFSPELRTTLLHWTPFLPWYLNAATFLTKVLPNDHPVTAALVADVGVATEEWRKQRGMSLRGGKTRPDFLLGGYPVGKGDQVIRVGRYTPFGIGADPASSASELILPQLLGPALNLRGLDWKAQRLKHPGYQGDEFNLGENVLRAGVTAAESMIPGVGLAGRVTGVTKRYVDKDEDPSVFQGKPILPALAKEYNPLAPTASRERKRKRRARKPKDILGGGGGQVDILK